MFNEQYDNEIRQIVYDHPHNFLKILRSKGLKKTSIDRQYLMNYIIEYTKQLTSRSTFKYRLKTLIYWTLNKIQNWDDDRLKCKICENPLLFVDVKNIFSGYLKQTCCKKCERLLAQRNIEKHLYAKYGVSNVFQLMNVKQKLIDKSDQMQKHRDETKRKRGTFNTSRKEEIAYALLCKKFSSDDIVRQYHSNEYPFNCDFYIKSKDLYIECNFSWTHGGHWFDETDENDLQTFQKWKNKNTKFYDNAIQTWTVRDVKKRKTAEKNHLNYIVVWNIAQLEQILSNFKQI